MKQTLLLEKKITMDTNKRKRKTLTYATIPSSSRRCREDHVASPDEWRDWASLPRDVLSIVLSRLPQTDILRAAGLRCSPWPRLALEEPQMWRHIDLREGGRWYWHEQPPPAGWKAMARAAVELSAGQCESFIGHVDADVLVHLSNRAPLLRKLYVTGWPYIDDEKLITEIIKKLPLLERFVLSSGVFQKQLFLALLDHCPRLVLLDATDSRPTFADWHKPIAARIKSCTIKDLRMPRIQLQ